MATIAEEAGYAHRQNASDIVQAIARKKLILPDEQSKGRITTVWRFNYELAGVDPGITLAPTNRSRRAAVNRSPVAAVRSTATAVGEELNRSRKSPQPQSWDCTKGLEGEKQEGASLMQFSQDQGKPKLQEPGVTRSELRKAIKKTAEQRNLARTGAGRKTPNEIDARRRLLLDQGEEMKRKYAN
jgi:hypothetical protein